MRDQSGYRAFRTRAIEQGRDAVKRLAISDYDEGADVHARYTQRIALRAARRWVQSNVSDLLAEDPGKAITYPPNAWYTRFTLLLSPTGALALVWQVGDILDPALANMAIHA